MLRIKLKFHCPDAPIFGDGDIAFRMLLEDFSDVHRHGAVEKNGEARDAFLANEAAEVKHQLLGSLHSKNGDDDITSAFHGFFDNFAEPVTC